MRIFVYFISVFIFLELILVAEARSVTIINNCTYTLWPALSSAYTYNGTKFSLQQRESMAIELETNWSGQLWGRTNCTNSARNFTCQTGDCGSGKINCSGSLTPRATTLVEFTLNGAYGEMYGVSLVHGYNIPVAVVPQGGNGPRCEVTGCNYDAAGACPKKLKLGGTCQGPCDRFKNSTYCCDGTVKQCKPTVYSTLFENACPRAYSYGLKYASTTFICGGDPAFTVTFCPSSRTLIREFSKSFMSSLLSPAPAPELESEPAPSLAPTPVTLLPPRRGNSTETKKQRLSVPVLVAVLTSTAILILFFIGIRICMKKRKTRKRDNVETEEIRTKESMQFDISTIRAATRNFSMDNKLGVGGFGEVYKGKLESGQEVAIKRLLQNSKQGVVEFKTEVLLVAKLQHKNLVKLLGFCMTPREKILVYEFLPNSSLDKFLFDPTGNSSLDWQTRFNIINGIARGLMYLHEYSRLTVIHRDLKTSNILLDEAMNPKIADFGLAKLFEEDQTHGDTKRIIGTYGYMAPEYAITGQYSVKSDVYSFGVVVIEIISGQKNRFFGGLQLEEALLHRAWRLWNEGKPLDIVDPRLNSEFAIEELTRCFHISLLCIQEDASRRPKMGLILDALSHPSISLPEPKPPRFFGNHSNPENPHSFQYTFTGTEMITDLDPRD